MDPDCSSGFSATAGIVPRPITNVAGPLRSARPRIVSWRWLRSAQAKGFSTLPAAPGW